MDTVRLMNDTFDGYREFVGSFVYNRTFIYVGNFKITHDVSKFYLETGCSFPETSDVLERVRI